MAGIIREFDYSKVKGRGKGVLGLKKFDGLKTSTKDKSRTAPTGGSSMPVGIARYDYKANQDNPGGFTELSLHKSQQVEVLKEHPNNEHWWEVRNNIGEVGFIPSSYILIQYQTLPWLQEAALACEEEERKERVTRLKQQKSAQEGTGWGPCPKNLVSSLPSKPYQSAYGGPNTSSKFYCEICDKKLNGIKPYQAHMASRAHKEELALLDDP